MPRHTAESRTFSRQHPRVADPANKTCIHSSTKKSHDHPETGHVVRATAGAMCARNKPATALCEHLWPSTESPHFSAAEHYNGADAHSPVPYTGGGLHGAGRTCVPALSAAHRSCERCRKRRSLGSIACSGSATLGKDERSVHIGLYPLWSI